MKEDQHTFRCIVYQEKDGTFTGVCLDLDIVEEEHISIQETILSINDSIESHMYTAAKLGFPKELMFRPAPKMYWRKVKKITQEKPSKLPLTQFQFFTTQPHIRNIAYA